MILKTNISLGLYYGHLDALKGEVLKSTIATGGFTGLLKKKAYLIRFLLI